MFLKQSENIIKKVQRLNIKHILISSLKSNRRLEMWCCASKPEAKKVVRSAKQQALSKVVLNLPPTIRLQYRKEWTGKVVAKQQKINQKQQIINNTQSSSSRAQQLKQKISQLQQTRANIQKQFQQQQILDKQFQQQLSKSQAIQTVLSYMIMKKQRQLDSQAMKIKT